MSQKLACSLSTVEREAGLLHIDEQGCGMYGT